CECVTVMIRSLVLLSTVWWCSAQLRYNGYPWVLKSTPLLTTPKLQQIRNTYTRPLIFSNYNNIVNAYNVQHSQDASSFSFQFANNHKASRIEQPNIKSPTISYGIPENNRGYIPSSTPEYQYVDIPSLSYGTPQINRGHSPTSPEYQYIESPNLRYGFPDNESQLTTTTPSANQYIEVPTLTYGAPEIDTEVNTSPPLEIETEVNTSPPLEIETELNTSPTSDIESELDQFFESFTLSNDAVEMDVELNTSPTENQRRDLSSAAAIKEDIAVADFSLEGRSFPPIFREAFSRKRRSATLPVPQLYMTPSFAIRESTNTSGPASTNIMELYFGSPHTTKMQIDLADYKWESMYKYINHFTNQYYLQAPKLVLFTGKSIYNTNSHTPTHTHS
ncbi:unnamed protein product, partial [Meganyctiphanes norvegica]